MKKTTYVLLALIMFLCGACRKMMSETPKLPELTLEQKMSQKFSELANVAELGTVEYTVKKVIKATDDKEWYKIGDRKILFRCTAYLKAGVDMKKFDYTKVKVDSTKKSVVVTLPKAELLTLNIPPEKTELIYEKVSISRSDFSAADQNFLLQLGEQSINEDVPNLGILEDAQNNARDFFKALLGQIGFESVIVKFE